jgi:hypothetical protein
MRDIIEVITQRKIHWVTDLLPTLFSDPLKCMNIAGNAVQWRMKMLMQKDIVKP